MINLEGSRFTSIMPENLASQPEVQAIAYAVGHQIEKLCTCARGARTYAAIATMFGFDKLREALAQIEQAKTDQTTK